MLYKLDIRVDIRIERGIKRMAIAILTMFIERRLLTNTDGEFHYISFLYVLHENCSSMLWYYHLLQTLDRQYTQTSYPQNSHLENKLSPFSVSLSHLGQLANVLLNRKIDKFLSKVWILSCKHNQLSCMLILYLFEGSS